MSKELLEENNFYLVVYTDAIIFEDDDEVVGSPRKGKQIEQERSRSTLFHDKVPVNKSYVKVLRG